MAKEKCLHPECKEMRQVRGLCKSCYIILHKLVAMGKTTWGKAEKHGKALPKRNTKIGWFTEG